MKRFLAILMILAMIFALSTTFVACGQKPEKSTTSTTTTTTVTDPEEPDEDVIEIIDGYIWVNGVNTGIKAEDCAHSWETVTTAPTCTAGGYDTITCKICGKSYTDNETAQLEHTYSTEYAIDDDYHWFKCTGCDEIKNKNLHNVNDEGVCTVCEMPVVATPGVVYDVSADGTYAEVVGYNGMATKVKIASEYKGVPVKTIYTRAFEINSNITHVVIPDSVTNIGDFAFVSSSSLVSVMIGNGVISIGYGAFHNCSALTSVIIPNSVKSIGDYAFEDCRSISSVVIGDAVISIGSGLFHNCHNLSSVNIGDSVISIGDYAFASCYNLTSIVIPNSVISIYDRAFYDCSKLSSVMIPDSVTYIGAQAFDYCHSSLYTEYEYGKYINSSDNPYAILVDLTNDNLSTYDLHEDTQIIADVFRNCERLTSITIPDSVTSIGDSAFAYCSALTSITIPDSVTSIGDYAFYGCSKLADVYYTGTQDEWNKIEISSLGNNDLTYATKHYNYVPQ